MLVFCLVTKIQLGSISVFQLFWNTSTLLIYLLYSSVLLFLSVEHLFTYEVDSFQNFVAAMI